MSHYDRKCFLCDSNSTESETDHRQRFYVKCSNKNCGNYEIVQDLTDKKLNDEMKKSMQNVVNEFTSPTLKLCDIHRNSNGEITITYGEAKQAQ